MQHDSLKFISLLGIELEGGWDSGKKPDRLKGDGSVNVRAAYVGEVCSPPLLIEDMEKFIKKNIPQHINSSCGTHIHFSLLKNTDYIRLMSREFYDFFLEKMKKWGELMKFKIDHPFWPRLNGENSYCKKEFHAEEQSSQTSKAGPRYCHLNYCFNYHGTIECRLFPGFNNPVIAFEAVKALVTCVEDYLANTKELEMIEYSEVISFEELKEIGSCSPVVI
jgi:hypothetical protein